MRKVHLDFETRSKTNIWDVGGYVYASDPSTEVVCLAYAVDNEPVKVIRFKDLSLYPLEDPFEELRKLATAEDTLFYAHNALFEQLIWQFCLQLKFEMPPIVVNKWRCTAAKALAHGLPKSLKDVARAMKLKQQKETRGSYLIQRLSKPQKDGTWNEDPELMREFEDYCAQDVETERELDHMLPELHPCEQQIWFLDQTMNQRGIAVDTEAVEKCLQLIDEETEVLKKEIFRLTDGKLDGVSRRLAVLDYFAKKGHRLPDFTKATVEKAVKSGLLPPNLVAILRIRQQLGLTSTAKYKALKAATCADGRLRDTLLYHSASTGRWGGKLVQMQNLPKGTIKDIDGAVELIKNADLDTIKMVYGNVMGAISSCVRGMFGAPEGHDLIVSDYSAIEARVLMWFCGQKDAVQMFRDGADIYLAMASTIFGRSVTEKGKEREVGKQATLGCGFQMGAPRFKSECLKKGGINIPLELAEKAVASYRTKFSKVPKMWYAQDRAVRAAIQTGAQIKCGGVTWAEDARGRNFLYCTLPSGRRLAYHKAHVGTLPERTIKDKITGQKVKLPPKPNCILYWTTDSETKKYVKKDIYGGKIIENIIQAIARDILAWAMIRAEKAGYKIVLTVHDELVAEVPEGFGSVEEFNEVITTLPAWAKGCPIDAEGWRGKRYKK